MILMYDDHAREALAIESFLAGHIDEWIRGIHVARLTPTDESDHKLSTSQMCSLRLL